MNTRVNIEIAKLLDDKKYPYIFTTVGDVERVPLNIPTIAEVIMWLYEKHQIWVSIDIGLGGFYCHYEINPRNTLPSNLIQGWVYDSEDNSFKSISEAYSAGILYTLENLIKI